MPKGTKKTIILKPKDLELMIKAWMNKMCNYSTKSIKVTIKDGEVEKVTIEGVQR